MCIADVNQHITISVPSVKWRHLQWLQRHKAHGLKAKVVHLEQSTNCQLHSALDDTETSAEDSALKAEVITDFNWWATVLSQQKSIGVILDQKNTIFAIGTDVSFLGWVAISQHQRTLKLLGMANVYHYPKYKSIFTYYSLKLE